MSGDWKTECQYCGKRMKDEDEAMDHANNCDGEADVQRESGLTTAKNTEEL